MYQFISPVNIMYGKGSLNNVADVVKSYDASHVMIYTDKGVQEAGIVERLENVLNAGNIEYTIYNEVIPEPPLASGNKAVNAVRESDADFVIGIGGGSSLDIAKAAAVLHSHEGTVEDYLNLTGTKKLTEKGLPKMLIPTTAGTGSEVTDIAVFSFETTKDVITDPLLIADVALVDPELTYKLPAKVTAASGVDALTHAIESYISIFKSPLTDTLAIDAMEKLINNLRTAVWDGNNEKAREEVSLGSLLAGMSFYNAGVAGVHALAYPLGGRYKVPHGEANAVLLPYVFDYIWESCMDRMQRVAQIFGINTDNLTKREASIKTVEELANLVRDCGLPTGLKAYGVKESDLEQFAKEGIEQTRILARSPKPLSQDDIYNIYKAAYDETLVFGKK